MGWLTISLGLAAIFAFAHASLAAREAMIVAARRACEELRVQLLDDTVALRRLALARDASGRLRFGRTYGFEFSVNGSDRLTGEAYLVGARLGFVRFDMPEGAVLLPARPAPVRTLF